MTKPRGRRHILTLALLLGIGCALLPVASARAQAPALPPEWDKVRAALEKYQDPYVAVRDGYLSTIGCVHYPKPGGAGRNRHHQQPIRGMDEDVQGMVPGRRHRATERCELVRQGRKWTHFIRHKTPDLVHPGAREPSGKVRKGLPGEQLHDAKIVADEVVVDGDEVRQDPRQTDDRPGRQAALEAANAIVQERLPPENRYLMMMPIMLNPVLSVPFRFPVIFDSPTRPR